MAEKTLNTRIQQKHDSQTNWDKATNFIPKDGEIIIYDADEKNSIARIKIGDGENFINSLPFITVQIDPSLTVEGAAADAKTTGDAIIGLGEALGEGLANVVTQEQLGEALAPIVEGMGEIGVQIEGRQSKAILSATQPTNWQNGDIWLKPAE